MNSSEIRKRYINFFIARKHKVIPSASLVPENDPTVLFTTAGMHPLIPYLLGEEHPAGRRLVNFQKCIRTQDIDEVGDNRHDTFFEMLGNWSLGDYFKREAIEWSWEFLTDPKSGLGMDPKRIAISCFAGDEEMGVERDDETAKIWENLGVPPERIVFLGKGDNWWGPAGQTGPCGPDTEMFYWTDAGVSPPTHFDPIDQRWLEVWNDVFMQYNRTHDGKFEPLAQKNVDTGMGLERVAMIMQGKDDIFETDLFWPILRQVQSLATKRDVRSERIITDHIRASVFIIADGVQPSNLDRGYVLRRLIRRAIRYAKSLGMDDGCLSQVASEVIDLFCDVYPKLQQNRKHIIAELITEEAKFEKTLKRGIGEFEKIMLNDQAKERISGDEAFELFATYGFPLELTREMAAERNTDVDERGFWQRFEHHQALSRTATSGVFKGGLADHSEKVIRLHTVTHLMHAALRKVLGELVFQKGSNITFERTRFDFTYPEKMDTEQKSAVERMVNEWIERDLPVKKEEMTPDDARKAGSIGVFDEKYGEKVSVYTIFDPLNKEIVSREFCGGPHVTSTGKIGRFKIIKEESSSAGVRRIKATVE